MEKYFEKWPSGINEITLGDPRKKTVKIGGAAALPFVAGEGALPNLPALALEIADIEPVGWPEPLAARFRGVWNDPVAWARECEKAGADLICLRFSGANPEAADRSSESCAKIAADVAAAAKVPLVIVGCEVVQKDLEILPAVSHALRGANVLLGIATKDNYKTLAAAASADGHALISEAPIDINLAKQLNILISDTGFPTEKIVVHQTTGALGYGYEYCYTIMERTRIAGLSGDAMMAVPMINFVGTECWKLKEAAISDADAPGWGRFEERGIIWESVCAAAYLQCGADVVSLYHPESVSALRKIMTRLSSEASVPRGETK